MQSVNEQMKIIRKGAFEILDEGELRAKLENSLACGNPLTLKLGLDPSAPDIHLGHTVVLRKIKQMQDLGHKAVIIIGDFTGRIGDPTGRSKTRNQLTEKEVLQNADTYRSQIFKILDPEKTTLLFNSSWLGELNFNDLIALTSKYTVARIMEREDFKIRHQNNQPIGLHEFFYPLMQAYDSLEIEADIELGGTDQRFNLLMGRDLQAKHMKDKQIALLMPLLPGIDGIEKMSKSLGNYIGIDEAADVIYEKVMQVPDALIHLYFELVTDLHPDVIEALMQQIKQGQTNPKNIKMKLAREIVTLYHGKEAAQIAQDHFVRLFGERRRPEEIPAVTPAASETLASLIVSAGFAPTSSHARRLIQQRAVLVNDQIVEDIHFTGFNSRDLIRVGKRNYFEIV